MLTMAPLRSCGKRRNSSRDVRNAPVSVTSRTAVQAARVVVSRGSSGRIAALLTRMDTGPNRAAISSKPCRTAASSSTRTSMPQRSSAPPSIAPSASSSAAGSDAPQMQTRAPAARSVRAIARPMFRLPPVTRATSALRSVGGLMAMTSAPMSTRQAEAHYPYLVGLANERGRRSGLGGIPPSMSRNSTSPLLPKSPCVGDNTSGRPVAAWAGGEIGLRPVRGATSLGYELAARRPGTVWSR